ncbi:MAG: hypothetical protein K940chlam3_01627 [Chlamydiae bacterium]|nr:hypothetical protein [Chlamydiota bacterium]
MFSFSVTKKLFFTLCVSFGFLAISDIYSDELHTITKTFQFNDSLAPGGQVFAFMIDDDEKSIWYTSSVKAKEILSGDPINFKIHPGLGSGFSPDPGELAPHVSFAHVELVNSRQGLSFEAAFVGKNKGLKTIQKIFWEKRLNLAQDSKGPYGDMTQYLDHERRYFELSNGEIYEIDPSIDYKVSDQVTFISWKDEEHDDDIIEIYPFDMSFPLTQEYGVKKGGNKIVPLTWLAKTADLVPVSNIRYHGENAIVINNQDSKWHMSSSHLDTLKKWNKGDRLVVIHHEIPIIDGYACDLFYTLLSIQEPSFKYTQEFKNSGEFNDEIRKWNFLHGHLMNVTKGESVFLWRFKKR